MDAELTTSESPPPSEILHAAETTASAVESAGAVAAQAERAALEAVAIAVDTGAQAGTATAIAETAHAEAITATAAINDVSTLAGEFESWTRAQIALMQADLQATRDRLAELMLMVSASSIPAPLAPILPAKNPAPEVVEILITETTQEQAPSVAASPEVGTRPKKKVRFL